MYDRVEFRSFKYGFERREIPNVRLDELNIRRIGKKRQIRTLDLGRIEVVKVVNDRYLPITLGEELSDKM